MNGKDLRLLEHIKDDNPVTMKEQTHTHSCDTHVHISCLTI